MSRLLTCFLYSYSRGFPTSTLCLPSPRVENFGKQGYVNKVVVVVVVAVERLKYNFVYVSQIDLKKMPLGKLTKRQIESAYAVLGEAQKVKKTFLK